VLLNNSVLCGHVEAREWQGVDPNPKVFDVIVDCFLKVAGYGSGLVGVGAGEKPIAQAGNAIFHVHTNGRMPNDSGKALYSVSRRFRSGN